MIENQIVKASIVLSTSTSLPPVESEMDHFNSRGAKSHPRFEAVLGAIEAIRQDQQRLIQRVLPQRRSPRVDP